VTIGILVINAGSTSVKFAGYRHDGGDELSRAARGQIEGDRQPPAFHR
jgi:acetate kinase